MLDLKATELSKCVGYFVNCTKQILQISVIFDRLPMHNRDCYVQKHRTNTKTYLFLYPAYFYRYKYP